MSSKYTYGLSNVIIHFGSMNHVRIGKFCSIGQNCNIYLAANHNYNNVTTYPFGHRYIDVFPYKGKNTLITKIKGVSIGNDVWIGANCTIMDGVTIGDGAILANNAHVVKNVNPYEIVGGNPAKHIKYRFSSEQIEKLLAIAWWNYDEETIKKNLPLLCNDDINTFIDNFDTSNETKYTYI